MKNRNRAALSEALRVRRADTLTRIAAFLTVWGLVMSYLIWWGMGITGKI